ncbi:carboxylesterase family protein [Streptomyces roseifaciens]
MSEQPSVRTTDGLLEGRWQQGQAVFRGIPYARPPVEALRFAAPVPAPALGRDQTYPEETSRRIREGRHPAPFDLVQPAGSR